MAEDTIYLKQFINLYNKCKPVEDLKLINEESLIYRLKTNGDSIRMGSTKKLLKYIPDKESMYSFIKFLLIAKKGAEIPPLIIL